MLAYTVPQLVFFFMVAGVAVMVVTIVARMAQDVADDRQPVVSQPPSASRIGRLTDGRVLAVLCLLRS